MAKQYKVPGVYIVEENGFPNSVVEVATAVPVFIGYTEKAIDGTDSLTNVPWRIESLADYAAHFGGAPQAQFTFATATGARPYTLAMAASSKYLMYSSLSLYFQNGGGPCYIVSIGSYTQTPASKDYFPALDALTREPEPTMLVTPDAVNLTDTVLPAQLLMHCNTMQSRIVIFDVPKGDKARGQGADDQITAFRSAVGTDSLNFGAAYYPWLNAQIVDGVDYTAITAASLGAFSNALITEATQRLGADSDKFKALSAKIKELGGSTPVAPVQPVQPDEPAADAGKEPAQPVTPSAATANTPQQISALHQVLTTASPLYAQVMGDIQAALNLLPPSGAIAGVYCRVDNNEGVFKAPANTSVFSVASPTVNLSDLDQEDLNMPLEGKAVNAIRAFRGRGTIVWGARTLDGNSQDWRYINVRRTMIMLEQSIKYAMQPYVFEANAPTTWVTVQSMIENFLTNQWKSGALVGSKPTDAFSVSIGVPSTMTTDDVLNGLMKVMVKVAPVRPAEFIELTFQQQMQLS